MATIDSTLFFFNKNLFHMRHKAMHSEMFVTLQSFHDKFFVEFFLVEMLIALIWQMIQLASVGVRFHISQFPWLR